MQTVITKYLAPTNTRGSRIKVTSWQGSKTYSYDYAANEPHTAAFNQWLEEKNAQMAKKYGSECPADGWFKLVARGDLPDNTGCAFIIK